MTDRQHPRPFCTHHCASCDGHFHSLKAFDNHRPGRCTFTPKSSKSGKALLEVWTREGWCRLSDNARGGEELHPVVIYTESGLEAARKRLSATRREARNA